MNIFKKTLKDPMKKDRSEVTSKKYVDSMKAEPLHNTNNAWQLWFTFLLDIAMQYSNPSVLKSVTALKLNLQVQFQLLNSWTALETP